MTSIFDETAHKSNCGALFVHLLMGIPNFPAGCCPETKLLLIKLFVKVRLYYIIKFKNRDLLSKNKRQNKTVLKVAHLGY